MANTATSVAVDQSQPSATQVDTTKMDEVASLAVETGARVQAGPPVLLAAANRTAGQAWAAEAALPPSASSSGPSIPGAWRHTPSFSPFERAWPRPRSVCSGGTGPRQLHHPLSASASPRPFD